MNNSVETRGRQGQPRLAARAGAFACARLGTCKGTDDRRRSPAASTRAFTLVEIVAVLVIIAIILAMTAPKLAGTARSAALRESARRVLVAARYARGYAAARGCEVRLVLDAEKGTFALLHRPNADGEGFEPLPTVSRPDRLGRGVRFERVRVEPRHGPPRQPTGERALTFYPTGEADAAVVQIGDERGAYTLLVTPHTGRVQLIDGAADQLPVDRQDLDV